VPRPAATIRQLCKETLHMRPERWSLEDLALVRAIAEAGSLVGAARALGLDHSSAFRRLGALEGRMGATLFRRSRRGYSPTEAGDMVSQAAERVLHETDALARQLAGHDRQLQGSLRVTVPDTLVELTLDLCAAFAARYPAVSVDLVVSNAFLTLQRRDADIALRPARNAPDGMSVRKLATIGTAVYAPESENPSEHGDAHRVIGFGEALAHLDSARWIFRNIDPQHIALTVDTLPAALAACQAGFGRALLPCYLGEGKPGIRRIGDVLPDVCTDLWCVIHPDLRSSARVRAFRDLAAQWARQRQALFSGGLRVAVG